MDRILKYCTHGFWRGQVVAQATNRVRASRATATHILWEGKKKAVSYFSQISHIPILYLQRNSYSTFKTAFIYQC